MVKGENANSVNPTGRPPPDSSLLHFPPAQNQWGNPATSTYIHAGRYCQGFPSCSMSISANSVTAVYSQHSLITGTAKSVKSCLIHTVQENEAVLQYHRVYCLFKKSEYIICDFSVKSNQSAAAEIFCFPEIEVPTDTQ
jgi:hypothetical protein